ERRMVLVALPEDHQVGADVVLGDLGDVGAAPALLDADVAAQVAPVGAEGVGGQAALDGEVPQVGAHGAPERGTGPRVVRGERSGASGGRARGQCGTSSGDGYGDPPIMPPPAARGDVIRLRSPAR